MTRSLALAAALAASLPGPAGAADSFAILALGDAPRGPDPDLAELTHQLRAACRDRVTGVEDVSTMRARLLGQASHATLGELDRAYAGALVVYQNGEFESALRTLRAVVEDLERVPEGEEAYRQWTRAVLRFAHSAATMGADREGDDALVRLLMVDPSFQPDAEQYSPTYRRHFEELRARVRARPRRRLTVASEGRPGTVYLNGRALGVTPVTLSLPAGRYRLGGAAGALRVPSFRVDLEDEDRSVGLDFALAESLRVNAGPGLALDPARRAAAIIRAGAWLGADKLVVTSRGVEGEAQFLVGSIYDVRRGALLREGSVRMAAGGVAAPNLGALAAFLLTGQSSREVQDRTPEPGREPVLPPQTVAVAPGAAALPGAAPREAPEAAPRGVRGAPPLAPPQVAARGPAVSAAAPGPVAALLGSADGMAALPGASGAPSAAGLARTGAGLVPAASAALAPATASPPAASPQGSGSLLSLPEESGATVRTTGARPWMRPAAIGAGVLALGFTGLAVQQGTSAQQAYSQARAMLGADGNLVPLADRVHYESLRTQGDAATRNAWLSAGAAVVLAAGAGALGWMSFDGAPGPPAIRF
ncbi:MAG TPA: PEGA domain-containing protein [Anaeromyxobacteraceae bacterium]|nr:PEGA domain-containing protein [Anaeromyxobacteraceae bacterium]